MVTRHSALVIVVLAALAPASAAQRPAGAVPLEAADCSRFHATFGTDEVGYAVQHASAPMTGGTLDVNPGRNGGVRLQRGAGSGYSITACIAAAGGTRDEAQRAAGAMRLQIEGGRVRVSETAGIRNASVHLIVEAPAGARIDATTQNGPIAIEGVNGTISARATNGPISVSAIEGTVRAVAANGPISISGNGGNVEAETQNGPVSVNLAGRQWAGELEARAQNGPLTLRVPDDFTSGLEVSSSGRSPWNCRIAACRGAVGDGEHGARTLRLGTGPVVVTLSTVNGPVTVDRTR